MTNSKFQSCHYIMKVISKTSKLRELRHDITFWKTSSMVRTITCIIHPSILPPACWPQRGFMRLNFPVSLPPPPSKTGDLTTVEVGLPSISTPSLIRKRVWLPLSMSTAMVYVGVRWFHMTLFTHPAPVAVSHCFLRHAGRVERNKCLWHDLSFSVDVLLFVYTSSQARTSWSGLRVSLLRLLRKVFEFKNWW